MTSRSRRFKANVSIQDREVGSRLPAVDPPCLLPRIWRLSATSLTGATFNADAAGTGTDDPALAGLRHGRENMSAITHLTATLARTALYTHTASTCSNHLVAAAHRTCDTHEDTAERYGYAVGVAVAVAVVFCDSGIVWRTVRDHVDHLLIASSR